MLILIKGFLFKKISPIGLSIFRILYHIVLFFEVLNIYNYRQLYFDKLPYLENHIVNLDVIIIFWLGVIFMLIIGCYFRIFAIINYVFIVAFLSSTIRYEYHMFFIYTGMGFLFVFLPAATRLSVDFLRKKLQFEQLNIEYEAPQVSKINYFLPLLICVGIIYLDSSIFYKIKSPMWLEGLGLWLPSSLPGVSDFDQQWLLNSEYLIKGLSHLTFGFELTFVFLFWFKRFRLLFLIIGVGLHAAIWVVFPIPYFALGCMSVFVLMIPVSCLEKNLFKLKVFLKSLEQFKNFNNKWEKVLTLFMPRNIIKSSNLLKHNPKTIEESKELRYWLFDKNKRQNIFMTVFMVFLIIAQLQVNFDFFPSRDTNIKVYHFLLKKFGVCRHGVFIDSHFKNYEYVYGLKYKGQFLPIIDEQGRPGDYLSGGSFIYWIWRVNGPMVSKGAYSLKQGMVEYSLFWAKHNGVNLGQKQDFEIVRKKMNVTFEWEKDLLTKNRNSEWETVGNLHWNKSPEITWN